MNKMENSNKIPRQSWFKVMWKNGYIILFALALAMTISGIINPELVVLTYFGIPIMATIAIGGFFGLWKKLKKYWGE